MDDNAPPVLLKNRAPARPWTVEEDALLRVAVAKHGDNTDHWKVIAEAVPGRTNKACRKRWKHSLSPTLKKTAWSKEEDDLLVKLHAEFPCRWSMIAKQISGRTDDACAKRYREALDPAIKQGEWTPEEDEKLLQEYRRWGGRWASVAAELGRSGLGCRNRWRLLERKKASHSSRTPASSPSCCSRGNESEATEDKDSISSKNEPVPSTQGSEGPPSPHQSTTSANDILSQIQYDPFRLDGSFFNGLSFGTDFSHCLDPELPGVGNVDGQTSLQFDARLWDIMQGGCGCGCGSKTGCGCGDDVMPPFMDISSQDFFSPFHQMTQVFSHGGGTSPVLTSSSHFPQFVESQNSPFENKSLAPASLSISALPSHHSQPMPNLPGPREPSHFTGEAPLPHYAQESNHNIPNFQSPVPPPAIRDNRAILLELSSSNSTLLPPLGYKLEASPQQQEQLSAGSSPALASTNPTPVDSMKWAVTAASLLARIKDQPPCKCSGTCCSPSSASTQSTCSNTTATSTTTCCSSAKVTGVKRPSSPIEASLSLSSNGFPPVMKRLKRQSSSASGVSVNPTPRLSSHLQASSNSNSQLLPYACGDLACWLSENDIRARFNTSGELLDHHRKVHHDVVNEAVEGRIFRCALEGCGKGWKSINGIQYHLQLSKAHFAVAINKQVLASSEVGSNRGGPDFEESESATSTYPASTQTLSGNSSKRKAHLCPHPDCPNIYKQAAGLKYHLAHGHPNNPPLQLGVVPPALAQKVSEKAKRTSV